MPVGTPGSRTSGYLLPPRSALSSSTDQHNIREQDNIKVSSDVQVKHFERPKRIALHALSKLAAGQAKAFGIQVVVRVRPMNDREVANGEAMAVQLTESDTTSLQVHVS